MNTADRTRLLRVLTAHVGRVAADLRAQMLVEGPVQDRARRVYTDEKVGDDYAVWTDLLSRRAAVMWVLKSVYARVLEDRGLLSPGRLLDPEAQQLFEKLAPNLGETAFLRWVWRDLAASPGGLPELFAPQPAEVAMPSDALSRELIEIWRKVDPDTGARWSFANEKFDGELMGDLYQELDPVVKDRFALCQTPDFVRAFILDRTLTPAIEEYGADVVRLIDPACGSGHFLIDGLRRLVMATGAQHPDWDRRRLVEHALRRVVGTDLNDYACALARARLIMTAADLAGVDSLREASAFHPHVYWADGLEQVEREEAPKPQQTGLFTQGEEPQPRATLTRPEVREALREVLKGGFHAVVANPPYIVESDENRKAYHREKVGRKQRYVSAYRQYSLGSPFTERCFQLAVKTGYVGIITSNNFMKREFGKPLIEEVLAGLDLSLVVDTSQAYIPFHGTPTVLLFGRSRSPTGETVRAVMGKRGETGTPVDPARGKVWSSIVEGWGNAGWENEYVSVAEVARETFGRHPWSLGGGGAAELRERLESLAPSRLSSIAEVGTGAVTREDGVYMIGFDPACRLGVNQDQTRHLVDGDKIRDWVVANAEGAIWPYDPTSLRAVEGVRANSVAGALWRWRTRLSSRVAYGKSQIEHGLQWFEYSMFFAERFRTPLSIAYAFVATHNHFVLDRGGKVFNRSAPIIKFPAAATESDHFALLGLLNSSTACFWMKQVFQNKGATSANRNHPDPVRYAYEFSATGVGACPVPPLNAVRDRLLEAASRLDQLAREASAIVSTAELTRLVGVATTGGGLSRSLGSRWKAFDIIRERMVALQEECDWLIYFAFGLAGAECLAPLDAYDRLTCPRGDRPFERIHGRHSTIRAGGETLTCEQGEVPPVGALPPELEPLWARRTAAVRASSALTQIETPLYKRAWRDTEQNLPGPRFRRETDQDQLDHWFAAAAEAWAKSRSQPFSAEAMVSGLQADLGVQRVAAALTGREDYSLADIVTGLMTTDSVPNHPHHIYTEVGLTKRQAWEGIWAIQRREDAGENVGTIEPPPEYSQGSRGKSTDFLRNEYWKLRGSLDVPKERFIAFTEVPGDGPTLYGWAGWTPLQRLKALLALDEKLEDAGHPVGDRIGVLDSAWRLLPDVAREDAAAAARLKAELSSLVGSTGPSPEMLTAWKAKFPPPGTGRGRKKAHP